MNDVYSHAMKDKVGVFRESFHFATANLVFLEAYVKLAKKKVKKKFKIKVFFF